MYCVVRTFLLLKIGDIKIAQKYQVMKMRGKWSYEVLLLNKNTKS